MVFFDRKMRFYGFKNGYDYIRFYINGDLFFFEKVGFIWLKYFSWF